MKYVARVTQVLRTGIHKIGALVDGTIKPVAEMPLPDRVEIEFDGEPSQPCMMYRYTQAGEFCGDTWHETLQAAFEQSEYEYGLSERDFRHVDS